mmetsp:Transcript_26696/g.65413  ORF Transcript_26696/g.65413 Transcript_26696/m.65413 type:complete len:261 (-) Transcript_26696:283-1065(-)
MRRAEQGAAAVTAAATATTTAAESVSAAVTTVATSAPATTVATATTTSDARLAAATATPATTTTTIATTTATEDDNDNDGIYALLLHGAAIDATLERDRRSLPAGFTVYEAAHFEDPDLVALSTAFAAEDPRVGVIHSKAGQVPGGRFGRAHLLRDPKGEAVAYTLTFENVAPPWDADRLLSLPPRLAHIYVRAQDRRRGIGTRMFGWWRDTFAVSVRLFAVDSPSEGMGRVLAKGKCYEASTRSGHNASSVHYQHALQL